MMSVEILLSTKNYKEKLAILKVYPQYIMYITDPSEEMQELVLFNNYNRIKYIKDPSEKVILKVIRNYPEMIKLLHPKILTDTLYKKIIDTTSGLVLKFLVNPSYEVQLYAIKSSGNAIKYVNNPSDEMIKISINKNGRNIKYINNQTEKLCRLALNNNPKCFKYIINPTEKIINLAVKLHYTNLEFVNNPSDELLTRTLKKFPTAIACIKNPSEYHQLVSIRNSEGRSISYIQYPDKKVQMLAVKYDRDNIHSINSYYIYPEVLLYVLNSEYGKTYLSNISLLPLLTDKKYFNKLDYDIKKYIVAEKYYRDNMSKDILKQKDIKPLIVDSLV